MGSLQGEGAKSKIFFVITKSNLGGAQKYVFDLATGLDRNQFEITVALGGSGPLIAKLESQNIRVLTLQKMARDIHFLRDVQIFFELLTILRKEKPDIIHVNSAKAGGIGAFAARLAGIPKIIFTAHGWAFNEERPWLQQALLKFLSWVTVILSHKTIAVSGAIKDDTRNWPFVSEKISVIKNGVRVPELLTREEAQARLFTSEKQNLPEEAFIVGTIAELHKNKGLSYAILAFKNIVAKSPTTYYIIIGEGEERANLETLIKEQDLEKNVILLGFVPEASRYLRAFDLFLVPSIKEGLPYVVLEAGQALVPVIATNVGGLPEILKQDLSGVLIPPRDTRAIENAVNQLRENQHEARMMSEALHKKIIRDFSHEQFISKTLQLYKR